MIFRALAQYRYLRSTYLHAFAGGASETRFKERLGDLFHEGFIERPARQWEFAEGRCSPAVYEIGKSARSALRDRGCAEEPRTALTATAHRQFSHSLMICECLASIEIATALRPGLRLVPWPEILARAPDEVRRSMAPFQIPGPAGPIVPDGVIGIEYAGDAGRTYRFFALEADRGTMPLERSDGRQTSLLGKLAAYRAAIGLAQYRSHLGIPNLFVLTVTNDPTRQQSALARLGGEAWPTFLFQDVAPQRLLRPAPELLLGPWERVGHAPLSIAEAG